MTPKKVGQFFFGRHYNNWGIWQCVTLTATSMTGTHIKDVFTYEDAVRETWRLNGWKQPTFIKKVA